MAVLPNTPNPNFRPLTKLQRIQQLSRVDENLVGLLKLTHEALRTLTTIRTSELEPPPPTNRRKTFESLTESYIEKIQYVDIHIKRQIFALDEADILPGRMKETHGGRAGLTKGTTGDRNLGWHIGNLDVGWLNSRSGKVERDMEAELWKRAREFLAPWEIDSSEEGMVDKQGDIGMGT